MPDGTSKQFYVDTQEGDPRCGIADIEDASAFATDGSGYEIVVTGYTAAVVYDNFGNNVFGYSARNNETILYREEDTNGNVYSSDPSGNLIDQMGRVPVLTTVIGNQVYLDLLNSGGSRSRYTVTLKTINVHTAFNAPFTTEYSGPLTVVQSISLPNGASYSFTYDEGAYGLLQSMTLPTGSQTGAAHLNRSLTTTSIIRNR